MATLPPSRFSCSALSGIVRSATAERTTVLALSAASATRLSP